jgi:formamidopyrimidine-DNA glycosylase
MPELAEVEFYRKQWDPGIGQTVRQVRLHPKARIFREADPRLLARSLTGARLEASMAHGKQMCFRFSGNRFLGLHLGMAGKLLTAAPEMVPGRHDHLVLHMDSVALVFSDYRMFGKVLMEGQVIPESKGQVISAGGQVVPAWWRDLPPQPQEPAFDKACLRDILKRRGRKPLKALLLDQDAFPGVGNWMADEILWRARIHPEATGNNLSPYKTARLFDEIKAVCEDALRVIGTNWGDPPDSWLFNHRWRRDGICPVSGRPLEYITVGGRTTCFSPAIQKA